MYYGFKAKKMLSLPIFSGPLQLYDSCLLVKFRYSAQ